MLKKNSLSPEETSRPLNFTQPLRIAFLGGAKSGKSSLISKLSMGTFRDNYYPTHKINPVLLTYSPQDRLSRVIMDEGNGSNSLRELADHRELSLSPVLTSAYTSTPAKPQDLNALISLQWKNQYYQGFCYRGDAAQAGTYVLPHVSPLLVEMIDTPAFDPARVVPFLEASLYIKLGKDTLHNLADEPRRPVSTHPLLVASGASELNGNIDGYFFVYSAVPSYQPPSYDSHDNENSKVGDDELPECDIKTFSLLGVMKAALDEAWREYNTFRMRWNQGKEHDIFHFTSSLKHMWKDKSMVEMEQMRQELRRQITLMDNPVDPSDPNSPPPIWIVCTHSKSPLRSPLLIDRGEKLAKQWNCGFIAVDNTDDNVDAVLALMVKEIVERKRLQSKRKK
ncbi:hypothetical protein DIURU_002089 [Diutina rugosa]|uniref:Uncharacterized protein n=1 Tax=Diutina rugosa TaxID=5481 RepID=A0A642UYE7_DIURU|nr:uncharacterized protein DIURU_002089 [Diutina rugosa]KAA8904137.1 hypothetical protein DIURU_002089 [Diutina rugosa]